MSQGDYCWWERGPLLCVWRGAGGVGIGQGAGGRSFLCLCSFTMYHVPLLELSPADLLCPVFSQVRRGQFIVLCFGFPTCEMGPGAHILS